MSVDGRRLVRVSASTRYRHVQVAAFFVGFGAFVCLFLTLMIVSVSVAGSSLFIEVAQLGRQVSKDASFLLPTLFALEAVFVGIPLGQSRGGALLDNVTRTATLGTFGIAALGVGVEVLSVVGAVGHADAARRLWSTSVLVGALLLVAFWASTLVFATVAEQLRLALREKSSTDALLRQRSAENPLVEAPRAGDRTLRQLLTTGGGWLFGPFFAFMVAEIIGIVRGPSQRSGFVVAEHVFLDLFQGALLVVLLVGSSLASSYLWTIKERFIAGTIWVLDGAFLVVLVIFAVAGGFALPAVVLTVFALSLVASIARPLRSPRRVNRLLPRYVSVRHELYRLSRRSRLLNLDSILLRRTLAELERGDDQRT